MYWLCTSTTLYQCRRHTDLFQSLSLHFHRNYNGECVFLYGSGYLILVHVEKPAWLLMMFVVHLRDLVQNLSRTSLEPPVETDIRQWLKTMLSRGVMITVNRSSDSPDGLFAADLSILRFSCVGMVWCRCLYAVQLVRPASPVVMNVCLIWAVSVRSTITLEWQMKWSTSNDLPLNLAARLHLTSTCAIIDKAQPTGPLH